MKMSIDFTAITKILNVLFTCIMISYCISLNFFVYVL